MSTNVGTPLLRLSLLLPLLWLPRSAEALPPGRAWTTPVRLVTSETDYFPHPLLHADSNGDPFIHVTGYVSGRGYLHKFLWASSQWVVGWKADRYVGLARDVSSPGVAPHIFGMDWGKIPGDPTDVAHYMVLAADDGATLGPFDTVTVVGDLTFNYSAAVTKSYRWAAVDVATLTPPYGKELRVFCSREFQPWVRVPVPGRAGLGLSLDAIDDSTAFLVCEDEDPGAKSWGFIRGATWESEADALPRGWSPILRKRSGAGEWLLLAGRGGGIVQVFANGGGHWEGPTEVGCDYAPGWNQLYTYSPMMSRDNELFPLLAWSTFETRQLQGRSSICCSIPADSGFTLADQIWSARNALDPSLVRDRNGDIWIAWWSWDDGGVWQHTYVTVQATDMRILGNGRHRDIAWSLTGEAPGSFWSVQRATGNGSFEDVARVRAGPSTVMSWRDDSPPGGILAYRVRRECVDDRYSWTSQPATWPANHGRGLIGVRRQDLSSASLKVDLVGMPPGPLDFGLYDLQGRRVWKMEARSHGYLQEALHFDLRGASSLPNGVYFLRISSASGLEEASSRVIILR